MTLVVSWVDGELTRAVVVLVVVAVLPEDEFERVLFEVELVIM